jgi:hypothetical protein
MPFLFIEVMIMKIAMLKMGSMTDLYGSRYDETFFKNLWEKYLLSKPGIEEVVYFDYDDPD